MNSICLPKFSRHAAAWGGLEGVTPPHRFKARTAAFDGQTAFTRAARSAGLRFAVILLSKAIDVGRVFMPYPNRSACVPVRDAVRIKFP